MQVQQVYQATHIATMIWQKVLMPWQNPHSQDNSKIEDVTYIKIIPFIKSETILTFAISLHLSASSLFAISFAYQNLSLRPAYKFKLINIPPFICKQ